jgi:predicted ATP-dependent endonuclease of OLD family
MRIQDITVNNYRTLVDCSVNFPDYYSAISGKNNAGKSNLLRVMRAFFVDEDEYNPFGAEMTSVSYKSDYPLWKRKEEKKESIRFSICISVNKNHDEGFYKFVQTFLGLEYDCENLKLEFGLTYSQKNIDPGYTLRCQEKLIEDSFKVQEIHKKLRTSNAFVFHNSTEQKNIYSFNSKSMSFGSISSDDKGKIREAKNILFKRLNVVAAKHKQEISEMLGRLDDKYEVGISIPSFDFESVPFRLSLGYKKEGVPLDDWGSGTQNRTHILLALLRAKKIRETGTESNRITPIIIIEEPESFLHPSGQAEFGMVLRDLAREFQVQVIVTTHSPHMLSFDRPDANILLNRRFDRFGNYETKVEKTTGNDWMRPFALALGVTSDCFSPWKDILFANTDELLLVEGEIDKAYFEDLLNKEHEKNKLDLNGAIFAYGGDGFFCHDVMLKFVLDRFKKVIITYDLDVESKVLKKFGLFGLKKNEDYFSIGLQQPGRRNIEGLLPQNITSEVASANPEIFDLATSQDDGNRDAKQRLKRLKQETFFRTIPRGSEGYTEFYRITSLINKALKKKRRCLKSQSETI